MNAILHDSSNLSLIFLLKELGHENLKVRCFFNNSSEEASDDAPKNVAQFPSNGTQIIEGNQKEQEMQNINLRYTLEDFTQDEVIKIIQKNSKKMKTWKYIYSKDLHQVFCVGNVPFGLEILTNLTGKSNRRMGFMCFVCEKIVKMTASMLAHAYSHIGIKKYSCRLCDKKYSYTQGLRRHWEQNHKDGGSLHSITASAVPKQQSMKLKPRSIKPTPQPIKSTPLPIKSTPKPIKSTPKPIKSTPKPIKSTLKPIKSTPKPINSTRKPSKRPIKPTLQLIERPICKICSRSYSSKRALAYHFNNCHSSVTNFNCEYCPKGFYYRKDYKIHVEREIRNRFQNDSDNINSFNAEK